jgi:phosphate transport system substrate-binding protein
VTINRITRTGGLMLGVALIAVACGGTATPPPSTGGGAASAGAPSSGGGAISGTVTVDGSSTVFPIAELVAEDFQTANSGVNVAVAESGTGGGFVKFCNGETDINDASRPIKADDDAEGKACTAKGVEYIELQIAIDGLTVVVNPANDFVTCLTVEELAKVYGPDSAQDLSWKDVNASFPDEPVERFMPGADSGTFDYFTEVINGETDAATTYATQSEDDNVLVTGVAGDNNAIGFFGYAYYVQNKDKLKAVEVDGGSGCVGPSESTINDGSYKPLSRPLFIYPNVQEAKERPELKAFVDFWLADAGGFASAPTVGYIAEPDALLAAEVAEWKAAVGG